MSQKFSPHSQTPKILVKTYNTSMSFTEHIHNIKLRVNPRLNALKSVASTNFAQDIKSTTTVYKQFIRSVMDYASPAWPTRHTYTHAAHLPESHTNTTDPTKQSTKNHNWLHCNNKHRPPALGNQSPQIESCFVGPWGDRSKRGRSSFEQNVGEQ